MHTWAIVADALRESWFWSQIMGEHAGFIHDNLAPDQPELIGRAARLREAFGSLSAEVASMGRTAGLAGPAGSEALTGLPDPGSLAGLQGHELAHYAEAAERLSRALLEQLVPLREFKEEMLQALLDCQVRLHLPPTLIAHMLNELAEAERALGQGLAGIALPAPLEALHQHLLWLPDASGHAALLHSGTDATEQPLRRVTADFQQAFDGLHIKAIELYSMLRVAPRLVGALRQLGRDATAQVAAFRAFLAELREHLAGCTVLGTLAPELAEHMLREELYYTEKLLRLGEA